VRTGVRSPFRRPCTSAGRLRWCPAWVKVGTASRLSGGHARPSADWTTILNGLNGMVRISG